MCHRTCWSSLCRAPLRLELLRAPHLTFSRSDSNPATPKPLFPHSIPPQNTEKGWQRTARSVGYLPAGEVRVLPQFVVEGLEEHLIRDFPHVHAGIVQNGNDPFVLLLHQVHDNLVVEVINLQETKNRVLVTLAAEMGGYQCWP